MLKVGDIVEMDKQVLLDYFEEIPDFYSVDNFIIISFQNEYVVKLNKNLYNRNESFIHISFLKKSIRQIRKEKLIKLKK